MIRPLRQVHRLGVPLLLVALLPVLAIVLHERSPVPEMESARQQVSIHVLHGTGVHRQIEVRLPSNLPEVLAYWLPPGQTSVDGNAVLIGRPTGSGSVIDIPDPLHDGQLLLYSLPLKQVIVRQPVVDEASP